jgi:uncharacterized protein YjiS (DUF1127 family)
MTTISLHYDSLTGFARHTALAATEWVGQVLPRGWVTLETWYKRASQRRQLRELDDRLLQDIGVSRADAWREGRKHFWDE